MMSRQWQRERMRRKRASIARERCGKRVVRWWHGERSCLALPDMDGLKMGYLAAIEQALQEARG